MDAEPETARLTRAELLQLPEELRTDQVIENTLNSNCEFLNRELYWAVVREPATELDRPAPKCFGPFRIFVIVREAVDEQLNQGD